MLIALFKHVVNYYQLQLFCHDIGHFGTIADEMTVDIVIHGFSGPMSSMLQA